MLPQLLKLLSNHDSFYLLLYFKCPHLVFIYYMDLNLNLCEINNNKWTAVVKVRIKLYKYLALWALTTNGYLSCKCSCNLIDSQINNK